LLQGTLFNSVYVCHPLNDQDHLAELAYSDSQGVSLWTQKNQNCPEVSGQFHFLNEPYSLTIENLFHHASHEKATDPVPCGFSEFPFHVRC
jgi:hypothetical protein